MLRPTVWMIGFVLMMAARLAPAAPLGTQFTYQGRLVLNNTPVNGSADIRFQLFAASAGGAALATSTHLSQTVTDGLFTVDAVQFGATQFNGDERYLEVSVRVPPGVGAYTVVSPRQRVAPAPYALQTRGLFVDASLNVGIGTTTPLDRLHVDGGNIRLTGPTAEFQMFNFNGPPGTETVRLIGTNTYNGGELRLYSGTGVLNVFAGCDVQQSGLIQCRNTNGDTRVQINGSFNDNGGAINVFAADGSSSILLEGESTGGGGFVGVRNAGGSSTLRLIGDYDGAGNGAVSIGESSPLAALHIETASQSLPAAALNGEDAVIEDADAVLGLYSGAGGSYGSTIALGEMNGGALASKWAMTRLTSSAGGQLRFTYGTDPNYGLNNWVLALAPDGTTHVRVLAIDGADVAERFPSADSAEPGTVMEIDPEHAGRLRIAQGAYNRRVAGVVSGAGDLPVGAVLGNLKASENGPAIALSGRVWVRCDASAGAIEIGDLLTTSERAGHAMTAADSARSTGAILGKAMSRLSQGECGLVLVLVSLQ